MNQLLMQLALAALGQFAGGGLGGAPMGLPMTPMAPMSPMAPITPVPTRATTPSLQLASLATATCLLRGGVIQRDQALQMMHYQGQTWGWRPDWGQRIPLAQVDQAIGSAGGCTALLERMQDGEPGDSRVVPATYPSPANGGGSFSEREGFGLAPYR
jgi:hypothetical protein